MQPEPAAQPRPGAGIGQLPPDLLTPGVDEQPGDSFGGQTAGPIDPQLAAVAVLMEAAGGKGRQPQGGRATEAPVGDQDGARLAMAERTRRGVIGAGQQLQRHRIHRYPGQGHQRMVDQAQAEQGRHRWHKAVAQGRRQPIPAGMAAGGKHQAVGVEHGATAQAEPETAIGQSFDPLQRFAGDQAHAGGGRCLAQGVHHRAGAVGAGKEAAIVLLHQLEAAGLEPGHRITAGEAGERTAQGLGPPGVMAHQGPRIPAGVGDIAASATADQHLVQRFRSGLQHEHIRAAPLGGRDRRHETGGTAASHHHGLTAGQHGQMQDNYRFSVAPMLDCTDRHFRLLMRQITRQALLYSEMVVARALHHISQEVHGPRAGEAESRLGRLLDFDPEERPLALQLGGDDPALLAAASRLACERGYDEVNLNVGCPSEKVQQGRFGACLMAEPERVARCVEAMAAASGLPITVKHRIGIDQRDSFEELLDFVDTVAAAGARRFAVHARKAWLEGLDPKQNRTVPPLRWDLVQRLKRERPGLCIELNGGLETLSDCLAQLELLDGVMVGRAAYAHPLRWATVDGAIFRQDDLAPVRASGVLRGLLPHAERWCSGGGRLWAIARHLVHLVEGVNGARHWRSALTQAAGQRLAGPEVLEAAARQLEERGY